ncbi:hypothetical protein BDN72DRAFT_901465 [Pluteus cervinus]|uniref:Uncharacterized protein n=1 Tax=Pluteus cervinus TaxID=181527 RepID=A0ACD3AFT7_9AGAR|nr:hypothetical protein BDN72DRAFT_901465 [Pluteus cervinus]
MRFNFLAPILLFFITWIFPAPVIAGIWTHQLSGKDLTAGCKFSLGTRVYDLCPLMGEWLVVGARTEKHGTEEVATEYEFTLNGSVQSNTCPDGTRICRKVTTHYDSGLTVASYTPVAGQTTGLSEQGDHILKPTLYQDDDDGSFSLLFDGGIVDNEPAMATIEFSCDTQTSNIKFVEYQEGLGIHSFSWTTPHACAIEAPQLLVAEAGEEPLESDSDSREDSADRDKGGEELLDPEHKAGSRQKFAIIMVMIMACMALISALLPFSPFRKIFPSCYQRRAPYRVTEAHLVQWAQEDTPLVIHPDEEAVMVNGWYFEGEAGLDEFIPLGFGRKQQKALPPKRTVLVNSWKGRVRDYGTTIVNKAW